VWTNGKLGAELVDEEIDDAGERSIDCKTRESGGNSEAAISKKDRREFDANMSID
jgi:hypothetical protein